MIDQHHNRRAEQTDHHDLHDDMGLEEQAEQAHVGHGRRGLHRVGWVHPSKSPAPSRRGGMSAAGAGSASDIKGIAGESVESKGGPFAVVRVSAGF